MKLHRLAGPGAIGAGGAPFAPQVLACLVVAVAVLSPWAWRGAGAAGLHGGAAALVASAQLAGVAGVAMRRRGGPGWPVAVPTLVAGVEVCLAVPGAAAALGALARGVVYAGLLVVFRRSLRPGREAVATRLARMIHGVLAPRRVAYTRAVTWMWTGFFAVQLGVSAALLVAAVAWQVPWFAGWLDLPAVAVLLSGELVVRAWVFQGEPHGSVSDMVKAVQQAAVRQGQGAR